MTKEIFIVSGAENSGKTHTVRYIAEKLVIRYMGKQWNTDYISPLKIDVAIKWGTTKSFELVCIVTISFNKDWLEQKEKNKKEGKLFAKVYEGENRNKSVKIGFCTIGDTSGFTGEITEFIKHDVCDIIICTCQNPYTKKQNNPNELYQKLLDISSSYNPHTETAIYNQYERDPVKYDIANKILNETCDFIDKEFCIKNGVETFFYVSKHS